jgi:hypothetical protein
MPENRIKETLSELHRALEQVDEVDPDMLGLLEQVDGDIHALLESDTRPEAETSALMERLEELGATFAARYPHTERFFQELIGTLGRLGI